MQTKQKTNKPADSAENFVASVLKYSVSTVVNLGIYAVAMVLISVLVPSGGDTGGVFGEISQFQIFTNTIMTIAIFGLDQAFIRFFNEPPGGITRGGLFRQCLYISLSVLLAAGLVCSLFFAAPLRAFFGFNLLGDSAIPLVFLNALFWMIARYYYVWYRMEQDIRFYTVTSILMNFFYKLFYLVGAFFENQLAAMVFFYLLGLGGFAVFCLCSRPKLLRPKRTDLNKSTLAVTGPFALAIAPTAVMVTLNASFSSVYVYRSLDEMARDVFNYGVQMSSIITAIQLGFAAFWGAYMYANYKTQQPRIQKVHDIMNLVILAFFALVVAFEDVLFWLLRGFRDVQPIFPLVLLSAVFTVLCETTTYGNAIARRPIFDTLGNALSLLMNIAFCFLLIPQMGIYGAAAALCVANFAMFLFRTLFAQYFYRTVRQPAKTTVAIGIAVVLAMAATVLTWNFWAKLAASLAAAAIYCLMYKPELLYCVGLARRMTASVLNRAKK